MQYQGGLEQLVLYSIEEDLKSDAAMFAPCCTDDYDGAIDAILRVTFRLYRPWENFNINQNGAKSFFTSNALICALLTFKYLSARDISFEKIVCNPILNEVVENNEGLKYEIKAFNENCRKIYNRNDRWEEKLKEEFFGKDAYIEQLEDFLYTNKLSLKVPSTYIFFSQEKIKDFLAPAVREIIWDIAESEQTETIDYKMVEVRRLFIEHMRGRGPVIGWEWLDDSNEDQNQRARKSALIKAYDAFCYELVEIGNKAYESESYSEYMMNEFAKEMIYHSRAITEFENYLMGLKKISRTMDVNILDVLEEDALRHLRNLRLKCTTPVVFGTDGLIFDENDFSRRSYVEFLKSVTQRIYVVAGKDSLKAYDILKKYIDNRRQEMPQLKHLKLLGAPSKQSKCRIWAIGGVLNAISPTWIYSVIPERETRKPDKFTMDISMGISDIR